MRVNNNLHACTRLLTDACTGCIRKHRVGGRMEDEKSIQSKGGTARAELLGPKERSEIAKRAATARWTKDLPKATHTGQIVIAGRPISCAVLETGKRLL